MNLPTTPSRFVLHFVKKQWVNFTVLIAAFLLWSAGDALFPYVLKLIVNAVHDFKGSDYSVVRHAAAGPILYLILLWGGSETIIRIQGIIQVYTFPQFRANIRKAVFDYVTSHSHEYFSSHFSGDLSKKLSDLATSCQSLVEIVCFQFMTIAMVSIIAVVMMFMIKPLFAAILLTWIIVHMGVIFLFMRYGNHLSAVHSDAVSMLSGKVVDVFGNMQNVRLFSRKHYEASYLKKFQDDEIIKSKKALWAVEWMRIGLGLNGLFLIFAMVFGLLHEWSANAINIGDFTQILLQSFWLLGWMWYLSFQMTVFSRELGTIENALSLMKHDHDLIDADNAVPLVMQQGEIRFDHVGFAYKKGSPVFDGLTVTIRPGEKIGLVGFSGSGKTTFVNLILRFYDLQSGRILIDGQDIAKVTQDSLREQIAMIPQDPALFHRTLMENIRYGSLDVSDDEVIRASKLAHCHEFISVVDEGYEALVGERGVKLSGGQRQRIAIARAILKNAPILVLDEATSALDSVTEKLIQESLQSLMQGRTTIVVAHRLSTLSDMDRILVFDKGSIIEEGSKDQLIAKGGHFAMLWNMQTDGFLPESGV